MNKKIYLFGLGFALFIAQSASAQHPLLDKAADRVVQKYQQSSCEQLWMEKGKPKPPQEEKIIQFLRSDPQMRTEFINRVAAPIANKMFECGMIP